jgi:transcriptional antiterminator RfaH
MVHIEEAGGLVLDDLQPGDPVRIVSGPFAGYEAVFDMRLPDSERVQVLLAFLSDYPQRLRLEKDAIERVKKP